ncbi:xylose transporter ATP-binding subunit [Halolamina pelagica]|uniref:Xylose transporter ATP-binding subunit n=1 Tax=Halolamina pelagica TaxID=699431 RepID=A0A0P7H027_9EURY|nr:xylose transporter ATP-binding subunit [Halolamina pelagica]
MFDELTEAGKTIIFISHKLSEVTAAADEVTVLRDGENVGTVDTDDVDDTELAELMVGREVLFDTEKSPVDAGAVGLAARDLVVEDDRGVRAVDGVDLEVAEGEVFGVAGVDGNGQSELVEALTGLRTPSSGRVALGART